MKTTIAKYIDHTLLKPESNQNDINRVVQEAIEHNFFSVCINPYWVSFCYEKLKDTEIQVCTVVGFPLGATLTETKVFETKKAILDGATEIDLVINIGELKSNNDQFVKKEIESIVEATAGNALVKVIIETSLLTKNEKIRACQLAKDANAHFVKTSTGFAGGGANTEDIILMRDTVGPTMGVKASGGVRSLKTAKNMIDAGATRIGASASIDIMNGLRE